MWRVLPEDVHRIEAFLGRLGAEERREVIASLGGDGGVAGYVAGLRGGARGEAFLVEGAERGDRVVAFGAYRLLHEDHAATITLAVDPRHRNRGLASLLLDRLAVLAVHHGVERLIGRALPGNEALFDLFRRSGLDLEERREGGQVVLIADVRPRAREEDAGDVGIESRVFAAWSLRPLLMPSSVAVIGASRKPHSIGHRIVASLVNGGYQGVVYPVNRSAEHLLSMRAYPSLAAIGAPVELAIVAVPAAGVLEVVDECAAVGVRGLIVVTAGFAEAGTDGSALQERLVERVRAHRMRLVGPNCLGVINTDPEVRMNASFAPAMPIPGTVALCSQSGALGVAIIELARRLGLGLSSFVSVGNKGDVGDDDLLEYWEEDPRAEVLLFYVEAFARPRRFARLARRVGRTKPIVVVKSGRTEAGGRAAGSHTAALSAPETTVDALFRQTGIVRADTLEEMFGVARALSHQPLARGRRVGVVTNAGGPGILCADALEAAGLQVAPLGPETRAALAAFLPLAAATGNPVDMIATADEETYRRAIEVLLPAAEIDALVVLYTPVGIVDTGPVERAIAAGVRAARERGAVEKPVFTSIVGARQDVHTIAVDEHFQIPSYPFPEVIGKVMGKVADYAEWRAADPGAFPEFPDQDLAEAERICRAALRERGEGWLTAAESRAVLESAGLAVAEGGVAGTAEEAVALAGRIGYPVAVKLASTQIVHKTEAGAVALDLAGPEQVRAAFEGIRARLEAEGQAAAMEGVLVQPMLKGAAEVLIGMTHDPVFGPVLAFGMGGIHVEVLRDVAFRVVPLTDKDAAEMVREIRGHRLLAGYRGHPAGDVAALEGALLRVSRLVEDVGRIAEIDLNPVFAREPGKGYRIADARIRVAAE